jgi:hypothetical protein
MHRATPRRAQNQSGAGCGQAHQQSTGLELEGFCPRALAPLCSTPNGRWASSATAFQISPFVLRDGGLTRRERQANNSVLQRGAAAVGAQCHGMDALESIDFDESAFPSLVGNDLQRGHEQAIRGARHNAACGQRARGRQNGTFRIVPW